MTTIQPLVRAKPERTPELMVKTHIVPQAVPVDRSRQLSRIPVEWLERSASDAKAQTPAPVAAEPVPDMKIYEAIDAVSAMILNAQAGLNWLDAEKQNLEGVRKALSSITGDAKRVAEIVLRVRAAR